MDAALTACDHEILLATYAVMTGRDAVDCKLVPLSDALLYLTDGQAERFLTLQDFPDTPAPPDPSACPPSLSLLDTFWRHQPCSACVMPCAECPHRAPALTGFLSLMRDVAPPQN